MKKEYKNEVRLRLQSEKSGTSEILTENEIQHLPEPVKKYIRLTGFVEKEKISNIFLKASGKIRSSEKSGWMQFTSEQYNFFETPFRAFYIRAVKMRVPAVGLHLYKNETAIMVINNPWETPVKEYRKFGDYYLPSIADVIYKRPEGDFCYLEFRLEELKYNVKNLVP